MKYFLYRNQPLSYLEYGNPSGFPIIVQHGMIASIKDDSLFTDCLKKRARIICVARPGYGQSSPIFLDNYKEWGEIIYSLAKELSLEKFDILSSSAGSPYGYAIGITCPDLVRNIYVYSGIPALYNENVQSKWPYPIIKDISQQEAEKIAFDMFFANMPEEMAHIPYIEDSIKNNCFGVGQELRIRFEDWGFDLSDIKAKVYMQHCKQDEIVPFETAEITARLLSDCHLNLVDEGSHFSVESYQDFIEETVVPNIYES
ncbi:alpha/beta fold hydrolase [Prevotella sp. 10(H)]|uniref:alpha/beta fold hydrolase n=1 Tax=Prevotella sp. 10(H) TaxID=1158294 RepID=UPI0004A6FAFA|nr:alpha/beta hydrolase [Prevotella sp. 10(H)]